MFILDRIDRSWTPLCQTLGAQIWLKFSECFDSIPLRILLDVLFRLFRFSKASFYACPGIFIHDILKLRRHLDTETYGKLPWQFCNFTCEITNYRWNFAPKLRSYSSPMIHESAKQNWKNKNCYRHHSSSQRSLSPVWFQLLTIFSSFMARVFYHSNSLCSALWKSKSLLSGCVQTDAQQCWQLLRACLQWCANGCNNCQQCWDLQCIVGRKQPISLCKPCVMSVRGPNNVGRAVQTDPTSLRYASAITEQKKCWELLAENFDRFHATGCANGRNV